MKLLLRISVAGILFVAIGIVHAAPTRRALVIGNDSYPGNSLQNARNDAEGMASGLRSLGYMTSLVLDADQRVMVHAIDAYTASFERGDVALVYYAGHGLQVGGDNYLVPTDFHITDESDVRYQAFPLSALLEKLTEHGASTQIIILDSCRDNPFLRTRSLKNGWASVATSAGAFLAFGTAPGSTASDDPGEQHGLFTHSLLTFLASPGDIEQMFQNVRADVVKRSHGRQVPWTASSLIGSFHIDPQGDEGAQRLDLILPVSDRSQNFSVGDDGRQMGLQGGDVGERNRLLIDATQEMRGLHWAEALPILERILSLDPRCGIALRLLGVVLHAMGRGMEATGALDKAINIDPKDSLAYSYRCLVGVSTHMGSSEADCRQAVRLGDGLAVAHLGLALALDQQGNSGSAYTEVTRALSLDQASTAAASLRDSIASRRRRPIAAREDH